MQGCIYLIKNTVKTVICEYIMIYSNCFFMHSIKAEFSVSLLQSSVSHDPSEIILICWFADKETFLIIISVETQSSFYRNQDTVHFHDYFDK